MGTKTRTPHHQLHGEERHGKRKPQTICLEKMREGHHNQTVSKATLGNLLRDGVESILAFPSAQIPS